MDARAWTPARILPSFDGSAKKTGTFSRRVTARATGKDPDGGSRRHHSAEGEGLSRGRDDWQGGPVRSSIVPPWCRRSPSLVTPARILEWRPRLEAVVGA